MIVYSQKLAAKLMLRGFILQGMEKNKRFSDKNIFHFKDSEELNKAIKELTNK